MSSLGRVAFLGTGPFGVPLLARVADLTDALVVVSQPDRPAGRGLQSRPSPIAAWARQHDLPVETPRRLRSDEARQALDRFAPDGLLLVAYGQLVPATSWPSGAAAPQRSPVTAAAPSRCRARGLHDPGRRSGRWVSLMVITPELDAGPIAAQWPVTLTGRETTPELEARLSELAAEVVPQELERWADGTLEAEPAGSEAGDPDQALHRIDGWLDWRKPAEHLDRQVRALQPWPGAWTTIDGKRLHVRAAHRHRAWMAWLSARCCLARGRRLRRRRERWRWRSCSRRDGRPCRLTRGGEGWGGST